MEEYYVVTVFWVPNKSNIEIVLKAKNTDEIYNLLSKSPDLKNITKIQRIITQNLPLE